MKDAYIWFDLDYARKYPNSVFIAMINGEEIVYNRIMFGNSREELEKRGINPKYGAFYYANCFNPKAYIRERQLTPKEREILLR